MNCFEISDKKWIEVNYLSSDQYTVDKNIRLKTSMLRSDLCDYSGTYILVKWRTTADGGNDDKTRNKKLIFKNNIPFKSWILKINNRFVDNAEDLDIV